MTKVRFKGLPEKEFFWFTDIIDNARKLEVNKVYTVKYEQTFSSWTAIKLVETGNLVYNKNWFE